MNVYLYRFIFLTCSFSPNKYIFGYICNQLCKPQFKMCGELWEKGDDLNYSNYILCTTWFKFTFHLSTSCINLYN